MAIKDIFFCFVFNIAPVFVLFGNIPMSIDLYEFSSVKLIIVLLIFFHQELLCLSSVLAEGAFELRWLRFRY